MAVPNETGIQSRADTLYTTLYGPNRKLEGEEYKAALETMKEVDEKYPPETYAPLEIKVELPSFIPSITTYIPRLDLGLVVCVSECYSDM